MTTSLTILYAFRDRDAQRVRLSLQSLQQQTVKDFEVLFVDYGSEAPYAQVVAEVVSAFDFATYHYVGHPGLLWNKSKALNYGIRQAKTDVILTADVDVLFAPHAVATFRQLSEPKTYGLFKVGYLPENVSLKDIESIPFENLKPGHTGDTFGIGVFPKAALEAVHGLDEFFHFYGSEDEDLNARLAQAGYRLNRLEECLFLHIWHRRYPQKKDNRLTTQPRMWNAQRLNQEHYLRQKALQKIIPEQQQDWGKCWGPEDQGRLSHPELTLRIPNIAARVEHFLRQELPPCKGTVVGVTFYEESYSKSLKHQLKKTLGTASQPYLSMKEVNDAVLKEIVFNYRYHNYSFTVAENLKEIRFVIAM